jgi:probable F420-dependent oxidoreductase
LLSGQAGREVERLVRNSSVTAGPRIIPRVESGRNLAARIGRIGLWCSQLQWQPAAREQEAVAELEELGFPAVWVGEATGKEALTHAGLLLAGCRRMVVATGIASIWARDPMAMANAGRTLAEAYPGRFVLGLGVSHPFLTEPRDRRYERPLEHMTSYLDSMDGAPFAGPPCDPPPRLLAALGPKMLELARERSSGAHPYFVTVEHTVMARETLGPDPVLAPEQAVVLERDPDIARQIARVHTTTYLKLANYRANLQRLGWTEEDMSSGGTDRLVDALVAWGGVDEVLARARAHLDAGADHVAIRVLGEDPRVLPMEQWRALAGA